MGNAFDRSSWYPPQSTTGQQVYLIDDPYTCCPPPPSFNPNEPVPLVLQGVTDQYTWSQFAQQLHETVEGFWDRKLLLVPFLIFCCCFFFFPAILFSTTFFQDTEVVTSNGSPTQPYCTSSNILCPTPEACSEELCRAVGLSTSSKFVNASGVNGDTVCWTNPTVTTAPTATPAKAVISEIIITAQCTGVPEWLAKLGSFGFFGMFGSLFLCVFCGQFGWIFHNQQVDSNILKLVNEFSSRVVPHGAEVQYLTMFTGICKPKRARPWRCLVVRNYRTNPTPIVGQLVNDSSDSEYELESPLRT